MAVQYFTRTNECLSSYDWRKFVDVVSREYERDGMAGNVHHVPYYRTDDDGNVDHEGEICVDPACKKCENSWGSHYNKPLQTTQSASSN